MGEEPENAASRLQRTAVARLSRAGMRRRVRPFPRPRVRTASGRESKSSTYARLCQEGAVFRSTPRAQTTSRNRAAPCGADGKPPCRHRTRNHLDAVQVVEIGPELRVAQIAQLERAELAAHALAQHGQRDPLRLGGGHGLADERLGVGRGSGAFGDSLRSRFGRTLRCALRGRFGLPLRRFPDGLLLRRRSLGDRLLGLGGLRFGFAAGFCSSVGAAARAGTSPSERSPFSVCFFPACLRPSEPLEREAAARMRAARPGRLSEGGCSAGSASTTGSARRSCCSPAGSAESSGS